MFRPPNRRAVQASALVATLAILAVVAFPEYLMAQLYWCFEICHGVAMIVYEATGNQDLANQTLFECQANICP